MPRHGNSSSSSSSSRAVGGSRPSFGGGSSQGLSISKHLKNNKLALETLADLICKDEELVGECRAIKDGILDKFGAVLDVEMYSNVVGKCVREEITSAQEKKREDQRQEDNRLHLERRQNEENAENGEDGEKPQVGEKRQVREYRLCLEDYYSILLYCCHIPYLVVH